MANIRSGILVVVAVLIGWFFWGPTPALASDAEYTLVIKDHRFQPETLKVPAGAKIKLTVINQDPTPEEFESFELNREKVVAGGSKIIVYIGPLKAGTYPFFGDFNQATAHGQIVVE